MKHVIVIGGGVAGLQCATEIAHEGVRVTLLEKDGATGGKLRSWNNLFPTFTPADEVLAPLHRQASQLNPLTLRTGCEAVDIAPGRVTLASGEELTADAVVVATGFTIFDASVKEEYGYGIYDNVITSVDLERKLREGTVRMHDGSEPRRIAILHCVGSRDEKVCQRHCSKVCCVTGVKQAIELKRLFPKADVYNFYMDLRMFGPGYEEMYHEAQQRYNINFVRGRISEVSPTIDNRLQLKAEDTLTGRPLKMGADLLVLMVGMQANALNRRLADRIGALRIQPSGFMQPRDPFQGNVYSQCEGIFYAGAVTAPKNVCESLGDGMSAARAVLHWLSEQRQSDGTGSNEPRNDD